MLEALYYELSTAAARQLGLITRAQAARLGADAATIDRLRQDKLLRELDDDVFQLSSSLTALGYAYPYAAWLALDPERFRWERPREPAEDAVLSHHSAARLHKLGNIALPLTAFTAPQAGHTPRAVVVHAGRLAPEDITAVGGVPVTTVHRTILDLVRYPYDRDEIGRVLNDALRLDVVDLRAIHEALVPLAAERGFPADGAAFLRYFLPDLVPTALAPRNLRAYAELAAPEEVARIEPRIAEILSDIRPADEADHALSREVAAEIVGRLRRR
ncbi:hypothetical protein BJY24_001723 [Nocardia transvalensis]|uniref:Uncharacterized protein n=1 Tax=Nocardia transvalensis TaxID=37333 RepID=A0A7W9UH64_9NOCA|nr:hypothetical protein [Nocardia transvalensis]MBB5912856.1 hypothetical protein [Nocardia transvalensis]